MKKGDNVLISHEVTHKSDWTQGTVIDVEYKTNNMSTATLTSLLDYLYGTLSPSNMRWVGEHLIEYSKKEESEQLRPYTMQEIDDMLDEAEAAFEAGDYLTNDEVFHHQEKVVV